MLTGEREKKIKALIDKAGLNFGGCCAPVSLCKHDSGYTGRDKKGRYLPDCCQCGAWDEDKGDWENVHQDHQ